MGLFWQNNETNEDEDGEHVSKIQAKAIQSTTSSVSFSKVLNEILRTSLKK